MPPLFCHEAEKSIVIIPNYETGNRQQCLVFVYGGVLRQIVFLHHDTKNKLRGKHFVFFLVLVSLISISTPFLTSNPLIFALKSNYEKKNFVIFSFYAHFFASPSHFHQKSSENIYFSGIVGYFPKTRRDIFHRKNHLKTT